MSPLSRVYPQDASKDVEIGNENSQEAAQFVKTGKSKNDSFIDTSVRTREFQEGWSVTEKVVDDTGVAEGQLEGEARVNGSIYEAGEVCGQHQQGVQLGGHSDRVKERFADGYVTVIGHHGQQESLNASEGTKKEELSGTFIE